MIFVIGARGMLGHDVVQHLKNSNIPYMTADRDELDITRKEEVMTFLKKHKPTAVINCAAYTAVDKAEDEPEVCVKINARGSENLAIACKEIGAKLMYISTDYVFEGIGDTPYEIDDKTNPMSVYGKSKLLGEQLVKEYIDDYFIVRVSWLFGTNGNNFVKTMQKLGAEREKISVVNDQIGSPTYTKDLAALLCDMIQTEKYGTYHATNEGYCSWADFAKEIMNLSKLHCVVEKISSDEYKTKAQRPQNSRLSKVSLVINGFDALPRWEEGLIKYMKG